LNHDLVQHRQDLTLPGGLSGTTPLFQGSIGVEVDRVRKVLALQGLHALNPGVEKFKVAVEKTLRFVKFNSENDWLARVKTEQTSAAWAQQLNLSLDPTARVEAAHAIEQCAASEKKIWVRQSCIISLTSILTKLNLVARGFAYKLKL
jgi:hypothetical protein